MPHISYTEENYLKAIYFLAPEKGMVSTNAIAERLDTKAATVTDMLRKLGEKELLHYTPYKGCRLSLAGKKVAVSVLRKHRLWETFLVEKLEFGWDEVHDIAEQLEHIRSPKLTERLAAFLGHPKYDPHGDPIPNVEGVFPQRENLTLDQVEPGQKVLVTGVKDTSAEFLRYIRKLEIDLGHTLVIDHIERFDRSMQVRAGEHDLMLSALAASNIYVQKDA